MSLRLILLIAVAVVLGASLYLSRSHPRGPVGVTSQRLHELELRGLDALRGRADAPTGKRYPYLDRVASQIVGRPVVVDCSLTDHDTLGEVRTLSGSTVHLRTYLCLALRLYHDQGLSAYEQHCVRANKGPCFGVSSEALVAMHVLAHESYHLRGLRDESQVDCYSLQRVGEVARVLGRDPVAADILVKHYLSFYQQLRDPPQEYTSPDCRAGGQLDLSPNDGRWP